MAEERLSLSVGAMYIAAAKSLAVGNDRQAQQLADALLQRDPDDIRALILKSGAARNLGQFDGTPAPNGQPGGSPPLKLTGMPPRWSRRRHWRRTASVRARSCGCGTRRLIPWPGDP